MHSCTHVTCTYPCDAGGHDLTYISTPGLHCLPDEVRLVPPQTDIPKHAPKFLVQRILFARIPDISRTAAHQESWWVADHAW